MDAEMDKGKDMDTDTGIDILVHAALHCRYRYIAG